MPSICHTQQLHSPLSLSSQACEVSQVIHSCPATIFKTGDDGARCSLSRYAMFKDHTSPCQTSLKPGACATVSGALPLRAASMLVFLLVGPLLAAVNSKSDPKLL